MATISTFCFSVWYGLSTVGVGLVVVVLAVTVLVCDRMEPTEPPLRVGMTADEVEQLLGKPSATAGGLMSHISLYDKQEDWLGSSRSIQVHFDSNGYVVDWTVRSFSRTRPPWLDRALKAVGW